MQMILSVCLFTFCACMVFFVLRWNRERLLRSLKQFFEMEASDLSRRRRLAFVGILHCSRLVQGSNLKPFKGNLGHVILASNYNLMSIEHVISILKLHENCRCFFGNTLISLDHTILVSKSYQNYNYSYDVALVLIP